MAEPPIARADPSSRPTPTAASSRGGADRSRGLSGASPRTRISPPARSSVRRACPWILGSARRKGSLFRLPGSCRRRLVAAAGSGQAGWSSHIACLLLQ